METRSGMSEPGRGRRRGVEDLQLRDKVGVFRDREHAGQTLARLLSPELGHHPLVLAIPAGGVPVAAAMAQALSLPLDVAVVSKVTLPWNTESGYGAVAFDGTVQLNEPLVARLALTQEDIERGVARTRAKVAHRVELLRGGAPAPELEGRALILVDDGLASGFTMHVAVQAVRRAGAARVVVAVPTAHDDAVDWLLPEVDALYCANVRRGGRFAVADAYARWYDVSDEEVLRALGRPAPGAH
ncbi:MAG: phosphoribosyltransferase family protein [Myxococcota bacterium]